VVQAGSDAIKLKDARELTSGQGVLEIIVDGVSRQDRVNITPPEPGSRWVRIS
jgi:hypothetical protein